MIKYILYSILFLVLTIVIGGYFWIFYTQGTDIDKLNHREITFKELPLKVQELMIDISLNEKSDYYFIDLDSNYQFESIPMGPFINYKLLTNISTGRKYNIATETPPPYIIYQNKLYRSREGNVILYNNYNEIIKSAYYEYVLH